MTKTVRERYEKLYKHYSELLDKLMEAQLALVEGGVESYTIDDRTITKFDLRNLGKEIEKTANAVAQYESLLNGGNARKSVGVVIRDS